MDRERGGRRGVTNNLKSKPEQLETDCKTEADTAVLASAIPTFHSDSELETDCKTEADTAVLASAIPTFHSDSDARQAEGPAGLVLHQALVVPRIPLVALVDHQRFLQELDRNTVSGHETARVQWNPFLTEPDFSDSPQVTPLVIVTCTHTCTRKHTRTRTHRNTCMHMHSLSH